METTEYIRSETERIDDVEGALEGHVFHVTKQEYWPQILATGAILPNSDRQLPTTFGCYDAFFRNRGCVSVFDYRAPVTPETRDFRHRCWPFQAAKPNEAGVAILMLNSSIYPRLISWTLWKEQQAYREMVVPYVEAGHPGPIPVSAIKKVILFRRTEDPGCLAALIRRAEAQARKK